MFNTLTPEPSQLFRALSAIIRMTGFSESECVENRLTTKQKKRKCDRESEGVKPLGTICSIEVVTGGLRVRCRGPGDSGSGLHGDRMSVERVGVAGWRWLARFLRGY
jgi:hypothetical protein